MEPVSRTPSPIVHPEGGSEAEPLISADTLLVRRIRSGDEQAWELLINKYEGRLNAFAARKLQDAAAIDDVIQETFLGFHLSLSNFDERRSTESYLFAICSYKITDHLRRSGKRILSSEANRVPSPEDWFLDVPDRNRMVSSIHRSQERVAKEAESIQALLVADVEKWKRNQDWQKLTCIELLFVSNLSNKMIADKLGLSEQKVANYKSDYLIRMKTQLAKS